MSTTSGGVERVTKTRLVQGRPVGGKIRYYSTKGTKFPSAWDQAVKIVNALKSHRIAAFDITVWTSAAGTCCENGNFGEQHECRKSDGKPRFEKADISAK